MRVNRVLGAALGLMVAAAPAGAQQARIWIPVKCDIRSGQRHFLVNSAYLYVKDATESRFEEQRQQKLGQALEVLQRAVTEGGQADNPAAWYYFGRYYAMRNDAAGADSAFDKAEGLAPECTDDIDFWRRQLWVPTFNAGVQSWQAGNTDSAIVYFRQANALYTGEPQGLIYLATLYANSEQPDSAAAYFERGIEAAVDTQYAQARREALFNLARVHHRAGAWDNAIGAYRRYLGEMPGDVEALSGLAVVYSATGQRDSAIQIYNSIVARADSLQAMDLFQAGIAIFQSAPPTPDSAALTQSCRAETRQAHSGWPATRVSAFCRDSVLRPALAEYQRASRDAYRRAADAFAAGLEKNPFFRDGLYNLTNTYFALVDTADMLPTAQRLLEVDPLNRDVIRLVAQAWQLRGRGDSVYKYLVRADSGIVADVVVTQYNYGDDGVTVSGTATNFYGKAGQPFQLTWEFLNAAGEVLNSATVDVPALQPSQQHTFQVTGQGREVVAWRYRKAG